MKSKLNSLKESYLRGEIIFAIDLLLSLAASLIVVFGVRGLFHAGAGAVYTNRFLMLYIFGALIASAALFLGFRTYRIIIRRLSVKDLVPFFGAAVGKCFAVMILLAIVENFSNLLLLIVSLDGLLTLLLLIGVRVCMILGYEWMNRRSEKEKFNQQRILVYSTSDKSVATIVRLQNSTHYKVVGFLERHTVHEKLLLDRLPVYRFDDESQLERIVMGNHIDAILFSRDTDAQREEGGLIKYCSSHGVKTLIVPNVDEVADGQALLRPREVNVEDLLGRKEIVISLEAIKQYFSGKVVMVTGAAGSIGSELVRQLAGLGVRQVVLFDNAETPMHNLRLELEDRHPDLSFVPVIGDVRHEERLDFAFRTYRPQVVFHAAAYKHVPLMEENPCEAVLVNVLGTQYVAKKCLEYDVERMVMISTDKAVNPTNIMGCTKRLAEIYVQSLGVAIQKGKVKGNTKFVTTRFGNVLGSNGSVIPRFRDQIAHGGPVTVTHPEINRFFMTIPEACRLVMEAATMSSGNQIFVFDMGEPVKIDQLARRMITLAGFTPDKDIKVEYTGLRPGEKLYEEVLADDENTLPAFHERIRIAKVREYELDDILPEYQRLKDLSNAVDIIPMVKLMKEMVPEFKSARSSRFSELDAK